MKFIEVVLSNKERVSFNAEMISGIAEGIDETGSISFCNIVVDGSMYSVLHSKEAILTQLGCSNVVIKPVTLGDENV